MTATAVVMVHQLRRAAGVHGTDGVFCGRPYLSVQRETKVRGRSSMGRRSRQTVPRRRAFFEGPRIFESRDATASASQLCPESSMEADFTTSGLRRSAEMTVNTLRK